MVFGNFARSIAEIMTDRLSVEVQRTADQLPPVLYREMAVDLLQDIIWREGVVTRTSHEVVEFIDYSICMLAKDSATGDFQAVVREPLARAALLELFCKMGCNNTTIAEISTACEPGTRLCKHADMKQTVSHIHG